MNRAIFFVLGVGVLAGTLVGGALHAQFDTYGNSKVLDDAANRLRRPLPTNCGDWIAVKDNELDEETRLRLHCPAYVHRLYKHGQTGEQVAVTVLLGPAGPLAAHTPEDCCRTNRFVQQGERTCRDIANGEDRRHSFWEVTFRSQHVTKRQFRVLYAWSDGSHWQAAETPRVQLGDRPFLYKIQIVQATATTSDANASKDKDFLCQLIQQLDDLLIVAAEYP